jgi:hypothetical protein
LGVSFRGSTDQALTYNTVIRRWGGYNLFLAAICSPADAVDCVLRMADQAGRTFRRDFVLHKGWNKVQLDLEAAGRAVDLNRMDKVTFSFRRSEPGEFCLDDLILVDFHKTLAGMPDGPVGTLYAVQDGKRIRIGTNGRFELGFYEGGWIAWYDLSTDPVRRRNLLAPRTPGLDLYQVINEGRMDRLPAGRGLVTVHTLLGVENPNCIDFAVEKYEGEPAAGREPDEALRFHIDADGLILVEAIGAARAGELGLGVAVARGRGFDAVIGKMRSPSLRSSNRIEYVLFRRTGPKGGADLLMAVRPWKEETAAVRCRLRRGNDDALQAVFTGEAAAGPDTLHAMIRIWPPDIDHLGNAEIHVRKFLETNGPEFKLPSGSNPWQPNWSIK